MDEEFLRQQEDAVAHMREMNARSTSPMPPAPPFVRLPGRQSSPRTAFSAPSRPSAPSVHMPPARPPHEPPREPEPPRRPEPTGSNGSRPSHPSKNSGGLRSFLQGLDLPFLNDFTSDSDLPLLLGLLLLLWGEKADKKLLFALIYILM